jgi:peptidoglycan/xylan/chitin deacetylase (PgdA/CDA1 family)
VKRRRILAAAPTLGPVGCLKPGADAVASGTHRRPRRRALFVEPMRERGWVERTHYIVDAVVETAAPSPGLLRYSALAANAAFIAYGLSAGLWPVLALHFVLVPINV